MTIRHDRVSLRRTTVACFAAGVSGADVVILHPFDAALGGPEAFCRRTLATPRTCWSRRASGPRCSTRLGVPGTSSRSPIRWPGGPAVGSPRSSARGTGRRRTDSRPDRCGAGGPFRAAGAPDRRV
jgi:hypothetical protein